MGQKKTTTTKHLEYQVSTYFSDFDYFCCWVLSSAVIQSEEVINNKRWAIAHQK